MHTLVYRFRKMLSAATPHQISCESGEIASEKTLAMTRTMHFDGTLHVVIASGAKQSFSHEQTLPPDRGGMGL
ncbi:MAG: hypothetical protein U0586_03305 [Candidatus Brocadiaceae bacterium]